MTELEKIFIKALEKVEQEEHKSGKWINDKDDMPTCSECGYIPQYDIAIDDYEYSNYCPRCGAKMVEPQEKRCADCNHYGKLSLDCGRCDDDCSMYEPQESEEQTE